MLKNMSLFQYCSIIRLFKCSACNIGNMCIKMRHNFVKSTNDIHILNYGLKFSWFHTSTVVWKKRKTKEEKKYKNIIQFKTKSKYPTLQIWKNMTVAELAEKSSKSVDDVFEAMLFVNNSEYYDTANAEIDDLNILHELAKKFGYRGETIRKPGTVYEIKINKDIAKRPPPEPHQLVKRPPVVTIMGHVDHGKTTLLDSLRHTSVVSQEHGGITQHIGAFTVRLPAGQITFLDTPGHAAFGAMRARGAYATDIVVLVIAADDGIMEQTVESIHYAKEANVPVIVAINKIDKSGSDIKEVKKSLLAHGIQLEELGGDVQSVCISALKGTNLDQLIDAILTQAELMQISADPKGLVEGIVLEASTDTGRGKLSTALIQRGTLRKATCLVAGTVWAKVRAMFDEEGNLVHEAKPGFPVQIIGWKCLPSAGDEILEAESEKHAREIIQFREAKKMEEKMLEDNVIIQRKLDLHLQTYKKELQQRRLEGWYRKRRQRHNREKEIKNDPTPYLAIVLKGDVDGSVEAILDVLDTYHSHQSCRLDIVHYGVGEVTENDVELAKAFNGLVYCFNVKASQKVLSISKLNMVPIKTFNIIYRLIEDLKKEISSKLPLAEREEIFGEADVLKEFIITDGKKKTPVAGCRCVKGFLKKHSLIKVIRSDEIIYKGPLLSLRHEKNEVDTIKKGFECGLRVQDPEVNFFPGDTIISFTNTYVPQTTDWEPGF